MAGENPAHSAALLGRHLFGVHLNDGPRLGAEDGLMFGAVHPTMALELMSAGTPTPLWSHHPLVFSTP